MCGTDSLQWVSWVGVWRAMVHPSLETEGPDSWEKGWVRGPSLWDEEKAWGGEVQENLSLWDEGAQADPEEDDGGLDQGLTRR